jgi:hypothetical protein
MVMSMLLSAENSKSSSSVLDVWGTPLVLVVSEQETAGVATTGGGDGDGDEAGGVDAGIDAGGGSLSSSSSSSSITRASASVLPALEDCNGVVSWDVGAVKMRK